MSGYNPSPKKGYKRVYSGGKLIDVPDKSQTKWKRPIVPMTYRPTSPSHISFDYEATEVMILMGLAIGYLGEKLRFCRIDRDINNTLFIRVGLEEWRGDEDVMGLFDVDENGINTALTDDLRVLHSNPDGKGLVKKFVDSGRHKPRRMF